MDALKQECAQAPLVQDQMGLSGIRGIPCAKVLGQKMLGIIRVEHFGARGQGLVGLGFENLVPILTGSF